MFSSRCLFVFVGMYDGLVFGLGLFDGIKVDIKGCIYIGLLDGV